MSYFDEWLEGYGEEGDPFYCEGYFSKEDASNIRSIGCWSYTSSSKKGKKVIREELAKLGVKDSVIEEFILGVFNETDYDYAGWVD